MGGQGADYAIDPVAPCQGSELRDGIVHRGADAMCTCEFSNILAASACIEAERWWTRVLTRATAACWHCVQTRVSPRVLSSCKLSQEP